MEINLTSISNGFNVKVFGDDSETNYNLENKFSLIVGDSKIDKYKYSVQFCETLSSKHLNVLMIDYLLNYGNGKFLQVKPYDKLDFDDLLEDDYKPDVLLIYDLVWFSTEYDLTILDMDFVQKLYDLKSKIKNLNISTFIINDLNKRYKNEDNVLKSIRGNNGIVAVFDDIIHLS